MFACRLSWVSGIVATPCSSCADRGHSPLTFPGDICVVSVSSESPVYAAVAYPLGRLVMRVVALSFDTSVSCVIPSLVLAAGFSIFGLSEMANIRIFGLLSAFAALLAFIADLLVAPALLAVVEGHRARRAQAKSAVADG